MSAQLTQAEREIERRWLRRRPTPIKLPGRRQHGTDSGYATGCGCQACTAAHAEAQLYYNRRRGVRPLDEWKLECIARQQHGTRSRYRKGCRCGDCTDVECDYRWEYRNRDQDSVGRGAGTQLPSQAAGVGLRNPGHP